MQQTDHRLGDGMIPLAYRVDLDASPKRVTFNGTVAIDARASVSFDQVELHACALKVVEARIKVGRATRRAHVVYHATKETLALRFSPPLPAGMATITIAFAGKLNQNMHGLYLATDGREKALVSQCEATGARRIFPCFDEPHLKATLCWTIRTDPGLTVITNGVPKSRRRSKGSKVRDVHTFAPTRIIPTYLAAMTIGNLEGSSTQVVDGIPCRMWASGGRVALSAFAAEVTAWVLPWYRHYFGQPYNYQKLDQVAVLGFDAGAMENVGAIFYRQNLLLMDPATTSWTGQKRIAEVVAHEIAHQWFGNLVTMTWWDDLWLNEAFATWIAYKACDLYNPRWRMWDDFLESKHSALAADALVNTHPIYSPVQSPAEATELFDIITYEKGCAVLRMVESFLGEDAFRRGIQGYQKAFKNKNAAGADLWRHLEEASEQPVGAMMQSWIEQPGFPLVTLQTFADAGRTTVDLQQTRYFANAQEMQREHPQTWNIPLVLQYDMGNGVVTHRDLLQTQQRQIVLPDAGAARWVYPNADATGFFRTQLDEQTLANLLRDGLPHLSPATRMSLLDDQWALVRCGLAPIEQFMDVLVAYARENDHMVVRTLATRLSYIDRFVTTEADRPALAGFARWLFGPQLQELGWEPTPEEDPSQAVRRACAVGVLGDVGRDAQVLHSARQLVETELRDPTAVEANLATTACWVAALTGDGTLFGRYVETFLQRQASGASPELRTRYLAALPAFENPRLSAKVLNLSLDGTVPQEQIRSLLVQMLGRRATCLSAWRFIKKNWEAIAPKVGAMGIGRLVEATGTLSPDQRADVEQFFAAHPVDEAKRAVQKALEAMTLRLELTQRQAPRLTDWLAQNPQRRAPANAGRQP